MCCSEILLFDDSHSLQRRVPLEAKAVVHQLAWAGADLVGCRRGLDGGGVFRWAAPDFADSPALPGSSDGIACLAPSPCGRFVAAGGADAQVVRLDTE